ncbi:MAG: adenylosuccinate synthetase [Pseudomonadota bacterium]
MKAYVVIGAAFGDEGKGLMTDYLAAKHDGKALVVRFNGGAQAGHTVHTPLNQRHVFKHFGSGSLVGSATYLSEFFICNPILFRDEFQQLVNLNLQPKVFVNPDAVVTTPYDMMINQILEEFRNAKRHGSCGVGINETVERNLIAEFSIRVHELFDRKKLIEKLLLIQQSWVKCRLAALGIHEISAIWQERLSSAGIMNYFLNYVDFFIDNCAVRDNQILKKFPAIIFEGAQGLLLDEVKGFFPHVTRSATGLKNVLSIAETVGISTLEVFYMTRAYLTRHGSGPLPFELNTLPYPAIIDKTNVTNMYQGALRFAWLNFDLLEQAIFSDLIDAENRISVQPNLVVTCMDQLAPEVQFIKEEKLIKISKSQLLEEIQKFFPGFLVWYSSGSTRDTIKESKLERINISLAV